MHRYRVVVVLGLAAMVASVSTVGASTQPKPVPVKNATAYWAQAPSSVPDDIFPFTPPSYMTTANVQQFQYLMYRPLYWFGQGSTPALNESLSLASPPVYGPGNTVTVTLKPYRWSDGETVDAQDVMFWMNMLHAEKANWAAYIPGTFPDDVSNVVADSSSELTFTMKSSYNHNWFTYNELSQITPLPFAWDVTALGAAPGSGRCSAASYGSVDLACGAVYQFLSQEAGVDATNPGTANPTVTSYASNPLWKVVDGPWRLASFRSSGVVTMDRNPAYSGPHRGTYSKFVELPYSSGAAEQAAITHGRLDVGYLPLPDVSTATSDPNRPARHTALPAGFTLAPVYPWAIDYIPYNFNSTGDAGAAGRIFSQLYVRQAVQLLVDQPAEIKKVFLGYAVPTTGPVPLDPSSAFTTTLSHTNPYPYDPPRAVSLLEANGWKVDSGGVSTCIRPGSAAGDCGAGIPGGTPLAFTLQYADATTWATALMKAQKASWASAGIFVSLTSATPDTVLASGVPCSGGPGCTWELENSDMGWSFFPDVYPTGEEIFTSGAGGNVGSYADGFDDLYITATRTTDADLGAYVDYLTRDLPVIFEPTPAASLTEIRTGLRGVTPQNVLGALTPEDWYRVR